MDKFAKFCEEKMMNLVCMNEEIISERVPHLLAGLAKPIATVIWAAFSVFWVAAAGPITFAAEAVLYPVVAWGNAGTSGTERVRDALGMCFVMAFWFWVVRFAACIAIFRDGIWRRDEYLVAV